MYHFDVSRTAVYPDRYVLARTSTYHFVLPCTRGTGFQMFEIIGNNSPDNVNNISEIIEKIIANNKV